MWISKGYKLRYSGGMVPDVHHILAKVRFQSVITCAALIYRLKCLLNKLFVCLFMRHRRA